MSTDIAISSPFSDIYPVVIILSFLCNSASRRFASAPATVSHMKLTLRNLLYPLVLDAAVFTLDVEGSALVADVIKSVADMVSWPAELITFSHDGRRLKAEDALDYHTFDVPEATLNLIVRKRVNVLGLDGDCQGTYNTLPRLDRLNLEPGTLISFEGIIYEASQWEELTALAANDSVFRVVEDPAFVLPKVVCRLPAGAFLSLSQSGMAVSPFPRGMPRLPRCTTTCLDVFERIVDRCPSIATLFELAVDQSPPAMLLTDCSQIVLTPSTAPKPGVIIIFVQTLIFKVIPLEVELCESVLDLKMKVQEREGIPVDQMRIIFHGRQLEDGDVLFHRNIQWFSVVSLVLRMRGGGGGPDVCVKRFADLSDDDALQKRRVGSGGPSWRTVRPGLCLEGPCLNRQCEAFGQMVIIPQDYSYFDLHRRMRAVDCPFCSKEVVPETCGFFQCWWRFTGQQAGEQSEVIRRPWKEAPLNGGYHRFDTGAELDAKATTKAVDWTRLFVEAKPLPSPLGASLLKAGATVDDLTCALCLTTVQDVPPTHKTACSHFFHQACVSPWLKKEGTCPMCSGGC